MSTLTTGEVLDMAMTPGKSPDLDVQVNGYRAKVKFEMFPRTQNPINIYQRVHILHGDIGRYFYN